MATWYNVEIVFGRSMEISSPLFLRALDVNAVEVDFF